MFRETTMALRMFDYQCSECGSVEERLTNDRHTEFMTCGTCGGQLFKIISAPRVLKPGGEEGQSLKAIHEIQRKDNNKKLFSRP